MGVGGDSGFGFFQLNNVPSLPPGDFGLDALGESKELRDSSVNVLCTPSSFRLGGFDMPLMEDTVLSLCAGDSLDTKSMLDTENFGACDKGCS